MFFILHTYCYEYTAERMYSWSHLCFYKPCPKVIKTLRPKTPKHRLLALKHKVSPLNLFIFKQVYLSTDLKEEQAASNKSEGTSLTAVGPAPNIKLIEPLPPRPEPLPPVVVAPPAAQPDQPTELPPLESNDTSAQDFYSWLTDKNEGNIAESENVLFKQQAI